MKRRKERTVNGRAIGAVVGVFHASPEAERWDLVDLVDRVTGQGLFVQNHTKSVAGMRTIRPPAWVMDILKRRHAESDSPWVFPSSTGTLRDPDNTRARIRQVVAGTSFEGLHPRMTSGTTSRASSMTQG